MACEGKQNTITQNFHRAGGHVWSGGPMIRCLGLLTLSLPSSQKVPSPNLLNRKCISEVVRIGSAIIFHLRELWKAKFSILSDVLLLVRLQEKFDIDHSTLSLPRLNDQFQISPAPSPEISYHTVSRTWPFIVYSDERWLCHQFALPPFIHFSFKGWENVLFLLGSERVKDYVYFSPLKPAVGRHSTQGDKDLYGKTVGGE